MLLGMRLLWRLNIKTKCVAGDDRGSRCESWGELLYSGARSVGRMNEASLLTLLEPAIALDISFWDRRFSGEPLALADNKVSDSRSRFVPDGGLRWGNGNSPIEARLYRMSLARGISRQSQLTFRNYAPKPSRTMPSGLRGLYYLHALVYLGHLLLRVCR
jgi:hypothetical protein